MRENEAAPRMLTSRGRRRKRHIYARYFKKEAGIKLASHCSMILARVMLKAEIIVKSARLFDCFRHALSAGRRDKRRRRPATYYCRTCCSRAYREGAGRRGLHFAAALRGIVVMHRKDKNQTISARCGREYFDCCGSSAENEDAITEITMSSIAEASSPDALGAAIRVMT